MLTFKIGLFGFYKKKLLIYLKKNSMDMNYVTILNSLDSLRFLIGS